jgi:hypothetical protein
VHNVFKRVQKSVTTALITIATVQLTHPTATVSSVLQARKRLAFAQQGWPVFVAMELESAPALVEERGVRMVSVLQMYNLVARPRSVTTVSTTTVMEIPTALTQIVTSVRQVLRILLRVVLAQLVSVKRERAHELVVRTEPGVRMVPVKVTYSRAKSLKFVTIK